jgi:hypothetical protein
MGTMGGHDVIIFVQGAASAYGYCLFSHRSMTGTGDVALLKIVRQAHLEEPYGYHPPIHAQELFLG